MTSKNKKPSLTVWLWILTGALALGLLFSLAIYPENRWVAIAIGAGLIATLAFLVAQNRKSLASRTVAYGLNSTVTVLLILSIVGVLNFLSFRHQGKIDLTKDKLHTLSDQTVKLVKGLQKPAKAVFFGKANQKEQSKPLLENYQSLNPTKFEIEYTDPDREPARAKAAGIKKYGTLQLQVNGRDTKIEDITEEKITNALIKLNKDKSEVVCTVTGHGEKDFNSKEAEGYEAMKTGLINQSYEVKDLNLVSEGKIGDTCTALVIAGPTRAFLPQEVGLLREYLANGGRAVIAIDVDPKGTEWIGDLLPILQAWHVKPINAMVVDPYSRALNIDPSVAILATFSKENAITREFQGNAFFPFTRPLDIVSGAPAGMNVQWLAQSTPKSWAETNFKELTSGQVKMDSSDRPGPLNAAIAVEGKLKDSKATRNTRLVVFGSSYFATNHFSRLGGNADFFLNAVSWAMEDESVISIRAKESGPGKIELSQKQGTFIFLLTVIVIPALIAIAGVVVWVLRRRL